MKNGAVNYILYEPDQIITGLGGKIILEGGYYEREKSKTKRFFGTASCSGNCSRNAGNSVLATAYNLDYYVLHNGDTLNSGDRLYRTSGDIVIVYYEDGRTDQDDTVDIDGDGWIVRSITETRSGNTFYSNVYLYRPSSVDDGGAESYYRSLKDLIGAINIKGGDTHGYGIGTALPYSVMKALENNPEDTLVFKCEFKGNRYTFTILGADVKGKISPEIPWYGPYWLAQNFFSTTVIEPLEPVSSAK